VKQYLILLVHLFNGTVATMLTGMLARKFGLSIYWAISGAQHVITFKMKSFLPAFICAGLVVGYVTYVRVGGKAAFWIFLIPVTVFAVKILTFPSPSVFESGIATGWSYFFGSVQCSAYNLLDLSHSATRCVTRMYYLGSICSALSYSAGAALSSMGWSPNFSRLIRESGVSKVRPGKR
jgi:hypothetical protein